MSRDKPQMHKLVSINLVNWYLFGNETIHVGGDSLLIRGFNGAGKSSVLDAIQTVLAGGDENLLMMNAASSDGKKSGRTIRSYVLGEVAESPGLKACEPKLASNSYICLNFIGKTGVPFCFGMGFFARASDTRSLQKHMFLLEGQDLTEMDFQKDENTILAWTGFEQRLKAMPGKLTLCQTAREFRETYCQLISAASASQYISPDMMFRAIRNGLTFKEQKDISEFTRQYILPENNIDVLRIENDYTEYTKIQAIILDAKERLDQLDKIIDSFRNYISKEVLSLGYKWAHYEANVSFYDLEVEKLEDQRDQLEEDLELLKEELATLEDGLPEIQANRDTALFNYKNSDGQNAIGQCRASIKESEALITDRMSKINLTRQRIAELLNVQISSDVPENIQADFNKAQIALKKESGFADIQAVQPWPTSLDNIQATIESLNGFQSLGDSIDDVRSVVRAEFEAIKSEAENLQNAIEQSQIGEASLQGHTIDLIELLDSHGITVKPVCDLATINDEEWQIGIERFLGGNRESLIVLEEDDGDFDRALAIYRNEKDKNESLRRAKLVNPDKIFGDTKKPGSDFAGSLVESKNEVCLRYLRGLLNNVKLVETEEELRKERRAITKDGMVAGNGSISGGNYFRWILIGQEARKRHAISLKEDLERIKPLYKELYERNRNLSDVHIAVSQTATRVMEGCAEAVEQYREITTAQVEQDERLAQLKSLEENSDSSLEEAFRTADAALQDTQERIKAIKVSEANFTSSLNRLIGEEGEIEKLNKTISAFSQSRKDIAAIPEYDQEVAVKLYHKLCQEFGDDYEQVADKANNLYKRDAKASLEAKEKALKQTVSFCERFDIDDKEELVSMSPIDALKRCKEHADRIKDSEIIRYEADADEAREKMLINFRSEVVAKLKECFTNIDRTFQTLNHTLAELTFNSNVYRFVWPLTEISTLRTVHEYVVDTSDLDIDNVGSMFDEQTDHPAVEIIQQILEDGRLKEISDYRNFYSYDIISKNIETQTERKFSELLSVGSGGEKQAPFYVALGASFMSAYKVRKVQDTVFGGAAIAIFDEAFSKMDGNNAQAALKFFKDIGLQVILAAPPESEIKVGPYVDNTISIIRPGDSIYLDYKSYSERAKELLESDNPHINKEIVNSYVDKVKEEVGASE